MTCDLYSVFYRFQLLESAAAVQQWTDQVVDYLNDLLQPQPKDTLTADHLRLTLDLLASVFQTMPPELGAQQFAQLLRYHLAMHPSSAQRRISYAFIHHYLMQHCLQLTPIPLLTAHPDSAAAVQSFLASLPRLLWELKADHLETTEMICQLLIRVMLRHDCNGVQLLNAASLAKMRASMAPYFGCEVVKGGRRIQVESVFAKLPENAQCLVRNLIHLWDQAIGQ